jgi:TetR/AcrR family transcriptional regulator, transcriptional repressor for nem operon
MGRLASKKEETRERILRAAARALRKNGYEGLGVADVMKEAGLTHGGFYAHFESRDALLAEAADLAGAQSADTLSKAVRNARTGHELEALVDAYLSEAHVAAQEYGCAFAMAGSEVPRQPEPVKHVTSHRIKELVALVERQLPHWGQPGAHERALAIASTMVGALLLARATDDPRLSKALRKAARDAILSP